MPSHYDDSSFSYADYWQGRDYEHASEILALTRFLDHMHFASAADIGGGYGRLTSFLVNYANRIFLVEPSAKQRRQAEKILSSKSKIALLPGTAQKTGLPNASQDLIIMIRVMHHLPEPQVAFQELYRILDPQGLLIIEFANSHHFKARLKSFLSGQPILPTPIEKRSPTNIKKHTIPFVNHSPVTIKKQLSHAGFSVEKILSVSNLRSPFLKSFIPFSLLITIERFLQPILASNFFGPSIFILARKIDI